MADTLMIPSEFEELERTLNPRHKEFARAVVLESMSQADAARKAGYNGNAKVMRNRGYEMAKLPGVKRYMELLKVDKATHQREENRRREVGLEPGSAEWIVFEAAQITQQAKEAGQFGAAVSALNLLAKRYPEFSGGPTVDNRQVNLTLPVGTTLDELRALRDELKAKQITEAA